jgi:hypothetical protein
MTPLEKILDLIPYQLHIGEKRYTFGIEKSQHGYEAFYKNTVDEEDFIIICRSPRLFKAIVEIGAWACARGYMQKPKRSELVIFEEVPEAKVRAALFEAGKSEWNV